MNILRLKTVGNRVIEVPADSCTTAGDVHARLVSEYSYDEKSLKLMLNGALLPRETVVQEILAKSNGESIVLLGKKSTSEPLRKHVVKEEPTPELETDGPLNGYQINSLKHLEEMMEEKLQKGGFQELLQIHGTVLEIRIMIQSDPTLLKPILYQIHHFVPKLFDIINKYQVEFLAILNEPPPRRPSTTDTELLDRIGELQYADYSPEGIYLKDEDAEAIARLEACGFPRQYALESYLMFRDEDMAAAFMMENYFTEATTPANGGDIPNPEPAKADEQSGTPEVEASPGLSQENTSEPSPVPEVTNAFLNLQKALVQQGKYEEALVVAEQMKMDSLLGEQTDEFHHRIMKMRISTQSSRGSENEGEYFLDITDIRNIAAESQCSILFYSIIPNIQKLYIWYIPRTASQKIHFTQVRIDCESVEASYLSLKRSLARNSGINPRTVWKRVLKQLYTQFITPIVDVLPNNGSECIQIIPPLQFELLPFAALMPNDAHYFIEQFTISTSVSIHCIQFTNNLNKDVQQFKPVASIPEIEKLLNSSSDINSSLLILPSTFSKISSAEALHLYTKKMLGKNTSSMLLPIFQLKNTEDCQTVLNCLYDELLKGNSKAHAYRCALIRAIQIPEMDIWSWATWSLNGCHGRCSLTSDGGKKSKQKVNAMDYKYLKDKKIHVLYEKLVRTLITDQPDDPSTYLVSHMEENLSEYKALADKSSGGERETPSGSSIASSQPPSLDADVARTKVMNT